MTLLITEIHPIDGLAKSMVVFAADRRISDVLRRNKHHSTRKKVFRVPYLRAGIGYFGLAEFGHRRVHMSDWLSAFVARHANAASLQEFSNLLAGELNAAVPSANRNMPSGVHIAGYGRGIQPALPEFWFVRNVEDDRVTLKVKYEVREDFLSRDAPEQLGYDGRDPRSVTSARPWVYRNGDIRAHAAAWARIDESFIDGLACHDFRRLTGPDDYADWVRFKLEIIAYFYKRYCTAATIARPIDAFAISSE